MRTIRLSVSSALALLCAACTQTSSGPSGPQGPPGPSGPTGPPGGDGGGLTPTELGVDEAAPALNASIVSSSGATGPSGEFLPGDTVTVTFTLKQADGSSWLLDEMADALALVSGPTFNYQRVLPAVDDVLERAVPLPNGMFEYTFADPLPAIYAPPYHDSPDFGPGDGELAGQALLDGTYTVGLSFAWEFTVEGDPETYKQVGEAVAEILVGDSATLAPREVVTEANCNRCHGALEAHGGRHRELTLCLMCHTSGAEDLNSPSVAGGTPGVSIESRQMFHRIHSGRHLPSLAGIGVHPDGTLDYEQPPGVFLLAREDGTVADYSRVGFTAWPERTLPMPKDQGYGLLTPEQQAQDDLVRTGESSCYVCHGDPDEQGPLELPAQGLNHLVMVTRRACGACHDDVDWELPYNHPQGPMEAQPDDSECNVCHDVLTGGFLSALDGHRHPLRDPLFDSKLAVELLGAFEGPGADGDGSLDAGESVSAEFRLLDGNGLEVSPSDVDAIEVVLSGPSLNPQLLLRTRIPADLLDGPQPFTTPLPERRGLELVGSSTGGPDAFFTSQAPHLVGDSTPTTVRARASTSGGVTSLATPASAFQNYLDVASTFGFAAGEIAVIDDGVPGVAEYFRIRLVEGNRLWLSSPASLETKPFLERDHTAGAPLLEVQLVQLVEGVQWSLDAEQGEITELVELGAGVDVLVNYTTPFRVPAAYPPPLNDSPDLGEGAGEWTGKDLVPGTYRLGIWAHRELAFFSGLDQTDYRSASDPATADMLFGGASMVEPYAPIESGDVCQSCHQDLMFHGGRDRGFDTCILCHGTAGAEDLAAYAAPGAPATPGTTINFRTLLHRIHRGSELADADALPVVGEDPDSGAPELNTYGDYLFPQLPGRSADCARCHGESSTAWMVPAPRDHPTQPGAPAQVWTPVCAGCHDAPEAIAHFASQTAPDGLEACALCHSPDDELSVERVHAVR